MKHYWKKEIPKKKKKREVVAFSLMRESFETEKQREEEKGREEKRREVTEGKRRHVAVGAE